MMNNIIFTLDYKDEDGLWQKRKKNGITLIEHLFWEYYMNYLDLMIMLSEDESNMNETLGPARAILKHKGPIF